MTDAVDTPVEQDATEVEAAELAAAIAGYNARGATPVPPVDEPAPTVVDETPAPADEPAPVVEPTVSEKLDALKAEVTAMKGSSDPDVLRKLHGEIGDINRTIKQLTTPATAPVDDELTAALQSAEVIANEYPEIGGPMVRALKAIAARAPAPAAPVATPTADIDARIAESKRVDALESLAEEHPDYAALRDNPTPEYKAWLAGKTPESRDKFLNSWNPAVVARGLSEFKATLVAKQKKQDRLAAAVVTKGTPQVAKSSTLPDAAGFDVGYNKGPKRLK